MKSLYIWLITIPFNLTVFSQNVAINASGAAPATSAMLDISSTSSGMLIPRMSTAQKLAIAAPATGLTVYDTSTNTFWWFDGTIWIEILGGNTGWKINGNTLTTFGILGTLNNQDVRFYTNNIERMRIFSSGQIVVNATAPIVSDVFSSYSTGFNTAVAGYALGNGIGIYGQNTSSGRGVYGLCGGTGVAVYAINSSGTSGRAIEATISSSTNTDVVIGAFNNGSGRAGNFQNQTTSNVAISLFASNSTTSTNTSAAAVWGQSNGTRGVVGLSSLANNASIGATGQYIGGGNIDAIGVFGLANSNAGFGYGVVGQASWRAVFANGNFAASGTKAFQIDHPQDPANKFLLHYSLESPEVLNVYRGTILIDSSGQAEARLPAYFESINQNYSYQLTAIGCPMPQLHISEEIHNGVFRISGGVPGKKVNWVVMAERHDVWMQKNPESGIVEMEKKSNEKGKFLHPELYGQPEEKSLFGKTQANAAEFKTEISKTRDK